MKCLFQATLASLLALCISVPVFGQGFEGILKMEISSVKTGDRKMEMTIYSKDTKTMTEMESPQGKIKIYADLAADKSTMVMESMKTGMELDLKKAREMLKTATDSAVPSVEETSVTKVVNGHNCKLYHVISRKGDTSNWWMTKDVPSSVLGALKNAYHNGGSLRSQRRGPGSAAVEEMFKKGLVPMQVESLKDGKPESTISFVSYEQKHLDDSIFKIGDDIKIRPMPAGFGGGGQ
ncbi:MAG: DUF4412 domain-containing protein [Bacteroidota bacterium]|nr:DUF4412 domain-containing protein [Bacteroidota bacterium]MDP4235940.1 DUF4412 domain-containing protein [Bacteroidota bacterium]